MILHSIHRTHNYNRTKKNFFFDLPTDANNNLEHEINSIINHNELLAEHTIEK